MWIYRWTYHSSRPTKPAFTRANGGTKGQRKTEANMTGAEELRELAKRRKWCDVRRTGWSGVKVQATPGIGIAN